MYGNQVIGLSIKVNRLETEVSTLTRQRDAYKHQYEVLCLAIRLCLEAYHSEEEPGQFLYTAVECLEKRLEDLQLTTPLTPEEQIVLGQRERDLLTTMAQTRQELGYTLRS